MPHGEEILGLTNEAARAAALASLAPPPIPALAAPPSALLGLAAIAGAAQTFMRSDAAPALNQQIAPDWTGLHKFSGGLTLSNISPAQITADQNDYEPAGFLQAGFVRISSDAARNITGFGRDGLWHVKVLLNFGAFTITLVHESGASTANKRLSLRNAVNFALPPNGAAILVYDGSSDRWRALGG